MATPTQLRTPVSRRLRRARARRDDAAFAALYEAHFRGIHDLVARIVRDRDLAGDVVQRTFASAWTRWRTGPEIRNPKAWLYAIAHNAAIDELRRRAREIPVGAADEPQPPAAFAQLDPSRLSDPQAAAEDAELAALVWSAATALSPADYSLLHLHVREDLGADELAESLGVSRGAAYTRLSRMRDSLERAVRATLLVQRGRGDCAELDALLAERSTAALTPQLRAEVEAHVADCERCQESSRRIASPLEIFAALAPVPAAVGLRELAWTSGVHPRVRPRFTRARGLSAAGVAAAVAAALLLIPGPAAPPRDPTGVHSPSHRLGVPSAQNVVTIEWTPRRGALGYSFLWTPERSAEPPRRVMLPGGAGGTRSPPLAPGSWNFILRTRDRGDRWTDTVRVGPFVIAAAAARGSYQHHRHRGAVHGAFAVPIAPRVARTPRPRRSRVPNRCVQTPARVTLF